MSLLNASTKGIRPGVAILGLAAGALLVGTALAGAEEDVCNTYAQVTAKQIQQGQKCGLKGQLWDPSLNKAALVAWCKGVPDDQWRKVIADRNKQLQSCGS